VEQGQGGERLCEGVGMRAVARVFEVAPNTVLWHTSVGIAAVVGGMPTHATQEEVL